MQKALKMSFIICVMLVSAMLIACESGPTPPPPDYTPVPAPDYTHVSVSMAHEDAAYLVAVEGVWTVIEGVVTRHQESLTGEASRPISAGGEERQQYQRYSVWTVEVIRYLVDPVEHEEITLYKRDGFVLDDGTPLPSRFPVGLSEGEHAILFLSKESWDPLADGEYTLWAGSPFVQGKVTIVNGMARWADIEETADQFTARLQQYGLDAGRTLPD